MGKNTVQAQWWLEKCYSDIRTLLRRKQRFSCSMLISNVTTLIQNDVVWSGMPNEAVTPINIKQVLKIVMDDCKMKVREIAGIININWKCIYGLQLKIGHESFPNGCHICTQWNKSNNELMIYRAVWHCLLAINRVSCIGMWQWMKHRSTYHSRVELAVGWMACS